MTHETDNDPAPDPTLESALRDLGPEPPLETVDWDRLERAIAARAVGRLAVRDRKAVWWQPISAWARPAIPLGVAAAIALLLILRSPAGSGAGPTAAAPLDQGVHPADALLLADPLARSIYRDDPASVLESALAYEDPTQ